MDLRDRDNRAARRKLTAAIEQLRAFRSQGPAGYQDEDGRTGRKIWASAGLQCARTARLSIQQMDTPIRRERLTPRQQADVDTRRAEVADHIAFFVQQGGYLLLSDLPALPPKRVMQSRSPATGACSTRSAELNRVPGLMVDGRTNRC